MTNVTSPISNHEYSTPPAHSSFLVTVFGGARVALDTRLYADSVELGRLLAEAGYVVATGGYTGTMEAVLRGAREAGAHTVGYTCATFERDFQPNPWVVEERKTPVLSARIQRLAEESDAFVVVHGGLGTLAELALVWNMLLAGELPAKPLVVVGPEWPKGDRRGPRRDADGIVGAAAADVGGDAGGGGGTVTRLVDGDLAIFYTAVDGAIMPGLTAIRCKEVIGIVS